VKQLATQTAKSTEEITRHIAEVKAATGESVSRWCGSSRRSRDQRDRGSSQQRWSRGRGHCRDRRATSRDRSGGNEMTQRTHECRTNGAVRHAGRHCADHITETPDAVAPLQNAVVRAVRTSTTDVDRRMATSYAQTWRAGTASGAGTSDARRSNFRRQVRVSSGPTMAATATRPLAIDGVSRRWPSFHAAPTMRSTHPGVQRAGQAAEVWMWTACSAALRRESLAPRAATVYTSAANTSQYAAGRRAETPGASRPPIVGAA